MGERDTVRGRYNNLDESRLCCYGCSHSAAGEPWPSGPSGERPCGFCIRNPLQHLSDPEQHKWYDGSEPVSVPMDCYCTIDYGKQVHVWIETAKIHDTTALEAMLETQRKLLEANKEQNGSS